MDVIILSQIFFHTLRHQLVVDAPEFFVHACHDPDVFVVNEVDFLQIKLFGHFSVFVSKEELSNIRGPEYFLFLFASNEFLVVFGVEHLVSVFVPDNDSLLLEGS